MDVKTLCLGVLTEGDRTGYQIKQRFEEAFSHFFVAGYGSIYPALADLSRRGLVSCQNVAQERRPDKKVYSLTPAGERALVGELMTTPPRHKVRSEFLVLLYFAHLLPPARIAGVIDQMVAEWTGVLSELERCAACGSDSDADDQNMTPGMRFAVGFGQAVISAARTYVTANKTALVAAVADRHDAESLPLAGD